MSSMTVTGDRTCAELIVCSENRVYHLEVIIS